MARLQRTAAALCALLVLSAAAVDGAGLWGSSKKDDKASVRDDKEPAKAAAVSPQPTTIPAGDNHNVYWCALAPACLAPAHGLRDAARSLTARLRCLQVQRCDRRGVGDGPAG
jgi:hypothetical protein